MLASLQVMVMYGTSWCAKCHQALPHIVEMSQKVRSIPPFIMCGCLCLLVTALGRVSFAFSSGQTLCATRMHFAQLAPRMQFNKMDLVVASSENMHEAVMVCQLLCHFNAWHSFEACMCNVALCRCHLTSSNTSSLKLCMNNGINMKVELAKMLQHTR